MYDFLRDFNFNDFIGFGVPTNIRFNTAGTKDMLPVYWKKWSVEIKDKENTEDNNEVNEVNNKDGNKEPKTKDVGYKCVCRTVGINEEDIKITLEDYGICVQGKTEYEGNVYSQYIELPISKDLIANIESINYKTINGLTYIYLLMKEPKKNKVSIRKVGNTF